MGTGLHALVGVGPEVGKHFHTIYITPTLIHRLEALILFTTDFKDLEDSYQLSLWRSGSMRDSQPGEPGSFPHGSHCVIEADEMCMLTVALTSGRRVH